MLIIIFLFLGGLLTGILSGLFGVGGGFILVPLLSIQGVDIKTATGLSLVYIFGTAISGIFRHLKQHTLDIPLAFSFSLASVITAQLGTFFAAGLSGNLLKLLFGIMTACVAIFYFFTGRNTSSPRPETIPETEVTPSFRNQNKKTFIPGYNLSRVKFVAGTKYQYRINLLSGIFFGAVIGFVSGLFGVGGGFLMVPIMSGIMGVPLKIAVGTSLLSILAPAASGTLAHWLAGNLDLAPLPFLLLGGLIGAQLGARLMLLLKAKLLKNSFIILLLLVGIYMVLVGLAIL